MFETLADLPLRMWKRDGIETVDLSAHPSKRVSLLPLRYDQNE
jgi:muconolactone delta-isomerase